MLEHYNTKGEIVNTEETNRSQGARRNRIENRLGQPTEIKFMNFLKQ